MHTTVDQSFELRYKRYIPIWTVIFCLTSVVLFIGINSEDSLDDWNTYKRWGAPSVYDIFNGHIWGLVTSNFVHIEFLHLFFNLYWFWIFGKKIEFVSGWKFLILFVLLSATASSICQLSFSESSGIGLSGIVYGMFGFILIKQKSDQAYFPFLSKRIIRFFFFWLFLCLILTKVNVLNIGNAGHFGGLIFGILVGATSAIDNFKKFCVYLLYFVFLISLVFYSPFSISPLVVKAYGLHVDGKSDNAINVYKEILNRDSSCEFAKVNLRMLEVYKMEEEAVRLHQIGDIDQAKKIYRQILEIDGNNQTAMENLKRLEEQ